MDVVSALLAGLLAGVAIATQFGAVSALLLETAVAAGPRAGMAAGMGVASADLGYAAVAVALGGAAHTVLTGHEAQFRLAAGATLVLMSVTGLRTVLRDPSASPSVSVSMAAEVKRRPTTRDHYTRFLALTAINPLTIVYFASVAASTSFQALGARVSFVVGAGGASAVWHLLLTLVSGHAGRWVTPELRRAISIGTRLLAVGLALHLARCL